MTSRSPKPLLCLLAACALALVALPAAPPSAALAQGSPTLERGDRGASVKRLQRLVRVRPADGVFGAATVRAVKRAQRRHRLKADGVAGPATWRALRRAASRRSSPGRTASRGASVRVLQRRLDVAADGVFGPGTARAVRRWQQRRGMTADGIVGPATWRALGVRGARPVLKRAGGGSSAGTRRGGGGSGTPILVKRAIRAANRIARKPYRLGGGHGSFSDSAYDCSGTISYVLHAMGLLDRSRTSGGFESYGSPGKGRFITIYAHEGHAYMTILNRRFDSSARQRSGSRWTSEMRSSRGYVARHPPGL
jgi:peptidoglycan hydrolase-like protein with peptidoglycan-binding domain